VNRASTRWLVFLLSSLFLFDSFTLRAGHHWGDDYALYIHHAENIASGNSYANTGYIYNPYYPQYSPQIYPPVFPLLLSPIYKIFGMNLTAMKMEEVVFFVGALAVLFALFRDLLPLPHLLFLVAIIGFNPFFWNSKDEIGSDIPFLFFLLLAALLVERRKAPILAGLVAYLAIGTRTVGVVLLPAILIHELLRERRITRYAATLCATAVALLALQAALLRGDSAHSYMDQLRPTLHTVGANISTYSQELETLWATPSHGLSVLLYASMCVLALAGASGRQPVFLALFAVLYGLAVLLWPTNQGIRFLIPLVPLYVLYAVRGMQRLGRLATVSVGIALLVGYLADYRTENFDTIPEANGRPTFVEMCSYLRENTLPDDRVAFNRARSLSLFTDRAASAYQQTSNPDDLWRYWKDQGIRYVVVSGLFEKDKRIVAPTIDLHSADVELRYANHDFKVYRIR
jgi:hypothetical protein